MNSRLHLCLGILLEFLGRNCEIVVTDCSGCSLEPVSKRSNLGKVALTDRLLDGGHLFSQPPGEAAHSG